MCLTLINRTVALMWFCTHFLRPLSHGLTKLPLLFLVVRRSDTQGLFYAKWIRFHLPLISRSLFGTRFHVQAFHGLLACNVIVVWMFTGHGCHTRQFYMGMFWRQVWEWAAGVIQEQYKNTQTFCLEQKREHSLKWGHRSFIEPLAGVQLHFITLPLNIRMLTVTFTLLVPMGQWPLCDTSGVMLIK